jgi:hypothetical protein
MKTEEIVGKTFGYKGIGNMVYIVVVQGFELEGEQYCSDSYTGKHTLIYPSGESLTEDWACVRGYFESRVKSGEYKVLR